uniref:SH3 domain-containing protein n=1 Tax=Ciona savignyi TaxID=51511 RepID=H2YFX7_CIOSA
MYKVISSCEADANYPQTLEVSCGELVFVVDKTNDPWFLVTKQSGAVGYVLNSSITACDQSSKVINTSIDEAIAKIHESAKNGRLSEEQTALLSKLKDHRKSLKENQPIKTKQKAPQPIKIEEPSFEPIKIEQPVSEPIKIPENLGRELVKRVVEGRTRLTENEANHLIADILNNVAANIPQISHVLVEIVSTLPVMDSDPQIKNLELAFANLIEIKNDAQQRSWAVHDDESTIIEILNTILTTLSSDGARYSEILSHNDNEALMALVEYYQMEPRVKLRLVMLQIFGAICVVSRNFISTLLASVLPTELVREIYDHADVQRVSYASLVLSLIFSTGEPVPVGFYDTIGADFIRFLLNHVESGSDFDDIFVRLILAMNLHYITPHDNPTMGVMGGQTCTTFSEKVMLLINRGDDPVAITEHTTPPHSVLKFLQDIFSRVDTGRNFFYTNDLLVLIDIIIRNISDLPPGATARTEFLDLLLNLLHKSTYSELKHRNQEISEILTRISSEELPQDGGKESIVEFDKNIVEKIFVDF